VNAGWGPIPHASDAFTVGAARLLHVFAPVPEEVLVLAPLVDVDWAVDAAVEVSAVVDDSACEGEEVSPDDEPTGVAEALGVDEPLALLPALAAEELLPAPPASMSAVPTVLPPHAARARP
jgi:hypothetical protein